MTTTVMGARGLYTSPNQLAGLPEGAAVVAENVVVPRPGVYETRRGYETLAGLSGTVYGFPGGTIATQVFYKSALIAWGNGNLARYDILSEAWVPYTGTFLPPNGPLQDAEGNLLPGKVIFHETGGCLYFTTSKGVFRLEDPLGTPYLSGISEGLLGTAALTGTSGFLADGQSVAYRETWSKRTPDGRIIEGAPSGRVTIFNTTGGGASRNVTRTIPIPRDLPPDAFLRVWRTSSFPNALGPDENFAQVYEKSLAEMAPGATSFTFEDITPDTIRGDAAYFSANLGDGLVASKYRPPLATDVLTFRDSTVYVGSVGLEGTQLTLLTVSAFDATGPFGPRVSLRFQFADGSLEVYRYTTSTTPADGQFTVFTDGTPSQNIERTTQSLIRAINVKFGGRLRSFYTSNVNSSPGQFRVEARALDEQRFEVGAIGSPLPWFPTLKTYATATAIARDVSGLVSVSTAPIQHGLTVGQTIQVTSPVASPYGSGTRTVAFVDSATTFRYSEAGPAVTSTQSLDYTTDAPEVFSDHQGGPDFIAWSPLGEPDAVPVLNYVRVGKAENPVLSGVVLGNSLYLRKADGLYRLSGDTPSTFVLDQVDTTVSFIGPYAGFTLGGSAYSLTTEGLKTWTESGKPRPASVPVESDIRDLIVRNRDAVDRYAFATNYESERTMLLWMPSSPDSTQADFAYRYNYLTDAWTTETTPAMCAAVSPVDDKLYIGRPGPNGEVLVERKTRTQADYYDPEGEPIVARVTYTPQTGSDPTLGKNFNRMKYFMDPTVPMPTTLGVGFHTDWVPTPTEFAIPVAHARGSTFETLVDGQHKRGTRLYVTVTHSASGEKLALLGYGVTFYEHQLGAA